MSKYTTEVRFICELSAGEVESQGYSSLEAILKKAYSKVFDFAYPIFDESYKEVLETKILRHFYTREICEETVGLWKLRLNSRMNEIMPYYNKLYESELLDINPLYTVNMAKVEQGRKNNNSVENEHTKGNSSVINDSTSKNTNVSTSLNNTESNSDSTIKGNNVTNGISVDTADNTKWDLYNDTPQGGVGNIENESYLTNARKITDDINAQNKTSNVSNDETKGNSSDSSTSKSNDVSNGVLKVDGSNTTDYDRNKGTVNKSNSTEDYLQKVVGYNGANPSKLLDDYRKTFLNIDLMIINDLEDLFMQLW